jgi:predicted HTH transcriptional regulator
MKQPWEWDERDIQELIDEGVKESLTLDYKGSRALNTSDSRKQIELSKDVSAFANSAGGTLVYGVEEEEQLPRRIDSGYDPAILKREWLEQIINTQIQRRIDGLKINQIELVNSHPGHVIYVISVPQSNRAPHMASDHRFYKRYNFQSVPMEEYEVRDVARRDEAPDIHVSLTLDNSNSTMQFDDVEPYSKPIGIRPVIWNDSSSLALYTLVKLFIDKSLRVASSGGMDLTGEESIAVDKHQVQVVIYGTKLVVPHHMPLWEGLRYFLINGSLQLEIPRDDQQKYYLAWEIHSPGMLPRTGAYLLDVAQQPIRLVELTLDE